MQLVCRVLKSCNIYCNNKSYYFFSGEHVLEQYAGAGWEQVANNNPGPPDAPL
jgi:hypothetical protein